MDGVLPFFWMKSSDHVWLEFVVWAFKLLIKVWLVPKNGVFDEWDSLWVTDGWFCNEPGTSGTGIDSGFFQLARGRLALQVGVA